MVHIARGLVISKPIVLVGIMGAGKTTVGSRLAKRLNLEFCDTDNLVQEKVGCSLHEIIKYAGEDFFHQKEREIIEEVLSDRPRVISTGGSAFLDERNRKVIKEKAVSVWLKADYDVILERVSRRNTRPMLENGKKEEILQNLMLEENDVFSEADINVNSGDGPHMLIVEEILSKLKEILKPI
jgi:shikimate kinase